MTLQALDRQHFYLDDKLIDMVWINFQAKKRINAANYHEVSRRLNWLNKLALRLAEGNSNGTDEATARESLAVLGLDWYLNET